MKKIVLSFITILSMFLFISEVNAKVNVYMLTKEGCPSCEVAYSYFDELYTENSELFELVPFEVFDSGWQWNSEELKTLFVKTYEYFEEDANKALTPTIVIGDFHTLGLPNDRTIITKAIESADASGKDVIQNIAKKNKLNIDELKYNRTVEVKEKKKENETGKYDTIIIISIFAILIGGFIGLLFLSKK